MGVVTRPNSPYFWVNLERKGLPPLRESTRVVAKGLHPAQLRDNRRLATQIYATRMGDLARQRHGIATEHRRVTFRSWARWYLKHVTAAKRTADRERSAMKHLERFFGEFVLEAIDKDLAREYRTARRKVVKAGTINRELDVLKHMLTEAAPKYIPTNPLLGLRRLRAASPEARVLSVDEEAKLLEVMAPADQALLICALDALLRLSDIVKLQWTQDRDTYLDVWDPKGAPYRPPVSTRLRAALNGLDKSRPRVFAQHTTGQSVMKMFAEACRRAGIPHGRPDGMTFHGLRHTGATRASVVPGMSPRRLMALGGWRDIKSVLRYMHAEHADRALVDLMQTAPRTPPVHTTSEPGTKV